MPDVRTSNDAGNFGMERATATQDDHCDDAYGNRAPTPVADLIDELPSAFKEVAVTDGYADRMAAAEVAPTTSVRDELTVA